MGERAAARAMIGGSRAATATCTPSPPLFFHPRIFISRPPPPSLFQLKMPWACRPFAPSAVTAGELSLLADLEWRTSSPTPCDFAGALIALALPGGSKAAAAARAAAGAVADAAVEAASTGRAGPGVASARPSAVGAAAALIGLHGAGQGAAAAVFAKMMDEVRGEKPKKKKTKKKERPPHSFLPSCVRAPGLCAPPVRPPPPPPPPVFP